MKYVTITVQISEEAIMPIPIIFPNALVHQMVAEKIIELCEKCWPGKKVRVITAGDARIMEIATSGRSESLDLSSHGIDRGLFLFNDSMPVIMRKSIFPDDKDRPSRSRKDLKGLAPNLKSTL